MKQFFEGLGLGAALAQAHLNTFKKLVMTITFVVTTPIGVGVGIGVSNFFEGGANITGIVVSVRAPLRGSFRGGGLYAAPRALIFTLPSRHVRGTHRLGACLFGGA